MGLRETLDVAVCSDSGLVRSHNEDSVYADADLGIAILADGMGGYNAGEVASAMATTLLARRFSQLLLDAENQGHLPAAPEDLIADEIGGANAAIFNSAESQPQYSGMGTTLVFAWFLGGQLYLAHVGDSRAYLWRNDSLHQLTKDHSLLQEQIDSGMISLEEARLSDSRNLVTRALGVEPDVEVDIGVHDVRQGDILLLCSDGLNDMLDDALIEEVIAEHGANLANAAERLVERANDFGGRDNVSVILVRVMDDCAVNGGWWHRLLAKLK